MAKRVKMKPWKGWAVVFPDGTVPSGEVHRQRWWQAIGGVGDRRVRVLVTELPAPRARTKKKGKAK